MDGTSFGTGKVINMKEAITLIVFALIFAFLAFMTRNAGIRTQELETATAKIDRLTQHDRDIVYYVSFYREGQLLQGKSIVYPGVGKRLQEGSIVNIEYYFTKAGWPRVIIQDPELEPREKTATKLPKVLGVISLGFFVVAILFFLKNLFLFA